jgi:hypothetical protein
MNPEIPLYLASGVAVCALVVTVILALLGDRRETKLRRALGACRTSLEAAEIQRDAHRRQLEAQSVELARYRGRLPPDMRLTMVLPLGAPPLPDPEST